MYWCRQATECRNNLLHWWLIGPRSRCILVGKKVQYKRRAEYIVIMIIIIINHYFSTMRSARHMGVFNLWARMRSASRSVRPFDGRHIFVKRYNLQGRLSQTPHAHTHPEPTMCSDEFEARHPLTREHTENVERVQRGWALCTDVQLNAVRLKSVLH